LRPINQSVGGLVVRSRISTGTPKTFRYRFDPRGGDTAKNPLFYNNARAHPQYHLSQRSS
jgi:hypothetical protein